MSIHEGTVIGSGAGDGTPASFVPGRRRQRAAADGTAPMIAVPSEDPRFWAVH